MQLIGTHAAGGAGALGADAEDGDIAASLRGVTKDFGSVRGLDGVDLDFRSGEVTVLLGLSGSGKSTLLRHLNGLQSPTAGEVTVLGTRLDTGDGRGLRRLRRGIGFIFQHFHLVESMSVLENVCTGRLGALRGPRLSLMMYPRSVRAEAMAQLERVGLADRAFQRADTLSGGQKQRVAIARALIQRPRILLADEPVASLDPVSAGEVIDLLREIGDEQGLTVICSLHQVRTALDFADRIVGLQGGRVVLDERAAGLTTDAAFAIYDRVAQPDPARSDPTQRVPALAG
ncbi:phosphonate ABC transporter ATP-binding protein [Tomitella gaofuii]|uniref:phosphonate ABC transporter ATP-binding protein n=1 Tax=Tomitella gaofuii TaxID=2760083 RepID=UPI0015F7A3A5|nr:phosphonate ABC transporter ATP-binding protein [Tomitella gaofuii]